MEQFDILPLIVGLGGLLVGAIIVLLVKRDRPDEKSGQSEELDLRLRMLAEQQAAAQAQMAEVLRNQERTIGKALEDRLADFSKRMGESLHNQTEQQSKSLTDLRERLAVIDKAQQNITELSSQVVSLQDILSNKQSRGAFGEVQLRDIVESILPPTSYSFQTTLGNGKRADCLLELPNPPGSIVIDSKFPLEGFRALVSAHEEVERQVAARAFTQDVRKHIQDISAKYILPGETAESALMFLPSEAIYAELHANFPRLVEESFAARVWIVSPTTLMATLNTVRAVLKDVRLREQAGRIQVEILKLLQDVNRLDERVGKLQRHFDQSHEDLRQIRISTDKITRRGEAIDEIQFSESEGAEPSIEPPKVGLT